MEKYLSTLFSRRLITIRNERRMRWYVVRMFCVTVLLLFSEWKRKQRHQVREKKTSIERLFARIANEKWENLCELSEMGKMQPIYRMRPFFQPFTTRTVASAIEAVSLFPWNKSKSFFFAPSCGQMVNLFSLRTAADVFSHRHSNFFRYFVFLACVCLSSDMINCNWNLSSPLQTPNGSAIRNHRQCLQKMRNLWPMVPTNLVRHNFYFVSLR